MINSINSLLCPNSVAVVGASNNPDRWGYNVMKSILDAGYGGQVYPIHPKEREILGHCAYPSILDIAETVDMVSVCVAAPQVPNVIREAVQKKVKCAVVFSSGFREAGCPELEEELADIIRGSELRLLGPNVQGLIHTPAKLSNIFGLDSPSAGCVGIISQSGSVSSYISERMSEEGIGISTLVNLGNQIDLCESDFLDSFAEDEKTRVVALYLEGPKNGARFKEALIRCAQVKPVVILKPGSTSAGVVAARSHTASLAGDDSIFTYACRQFGAVRCAGMQEFIDTIHAFAAMPAVKGNRVAILSTSGGVGSIAVDELTKRGFQLAAFPENVRSELCAKVQKSSRIGNILDLSASLQDWQIVTKLLAQRYEKYFDSYFIMGADGLAGLDIVIETLAGLSDKPIMSVFQCEGAVKRLAMERLRKIPLPVVDVPERAAQILSNMLQYNKRKGETR